MYSAETYFSVSEECYNQIPLLELLSVQEHVGDWNRDVAKKLLLLPNSLEPLIYGLPVKGLWNIVPWDTHSRLADLQGLETVRFSSNWIIYTKGSEGESSHRK